MMMEREARNLKDPSEFKRSEFEAYWAPWDPKKSALPADKFAQSLSLPFGQRMMMEREMRGHLDAGEPRSEFMEFWVPRTFEASALSSKAEFAKFASKPYGKLMEAERAARGYLPVDHITETPKRSEYEEYWAPKEFKHSAIKDPAEFFTSLSKPMGERAVLERAARGVVMIA